MSIPLKTNFRTAVFRGISFLAKLSILISFQYPLWAYIEKVDIPNILQTIPPDDRKDLEYFFRELLFSQGFGYTLFGDKPISIENFSLDNPDKPDVFDNSCKGYRLWGKYAEQFPSECFIFLFHENPTEYSCELTLINKKAFLTIFNQHQEKFIRFFGSNMTGEKLLELVTQKKSLFNTCMQGHDDLIGILLGYGKNNAVLFQKRAEILTGKNNIYKRRMNPSRGYFSIAEELQSINTKLNPFSEEGKISLHYMRSPGFMADHRDPETAELKNRYSEQRKLITKAYTRGNFLEITFEQLCAP